MHIRFQRQLSARGKQRLLSAALSLILWAGLLHITYADALEQRRDAAPSTAASLSGRVFFTGLAAEEPENHRFAAGTELTLQRRELSVPLFTEEGETVEELLRRLRIDVEEDEAILVDFSGEVPCLTIGSDFTCEVERREPVPCTTRYEADPTLAWGEERVAEEGCDGELPVVSLVYVAEGRAAAEQVLRRGESTMRQRVIQYGTRSRYTEVKVLDYDGGTIAANGQELSYSRALRMTGTAYTAGIGGVDTVTATGSTVHVGVVAVDPRVIPLGSRLFIEAARGSYVYGVAVAEDTGVRGSVIDLYMDSYDACIQFGRRALNVYILS